VKNGDRGWCRRVILQEDEVIPARSERDVMTKVIFRGRSGIGTTSDWGQNRH